MKELKKAVKLFQSFIKKRFAETKKLSIFATAIRE